MNQTYMHELLFILNMVEGEHRVTGAHFKNLTRIDLGDGEVFEKMGPVTGIDLSQPGELEAALGPLSAAMVGEINQLKQQLNEAVETGQTLEKTLNDLVTTHKEFISQLSAMTARAADLDRELGHVTRERDEAQEREQALQQAAEAVEQDRQTLLDTLAQRSQQISSLEAEVQKLRAQEANRLPAA
ncbi:hypothetical protein QYS36_19265 [Pseudomonas sp. G34]|uniref:hypothetical protein n=1 Tax=Pseudomonas sp. G34 TaxID=3059083 RepID=UPI00280A13AC|nr:hypothetical protein [Pseudomonas sp. G34]MDQ7987085.1 hypothetical protein [Pseudomonas sp. G34]